MPISDKNNEIYVIDVMFPHRTYDYPKQAAAWGTFLHTYIVFFPRVQLCTVHRKCLTSTTYLLHVCMYTAIQYPIVFVP